MTGRKTSNAHRRRGSELVEFALVSFLLFSVIFAVFEFGRMVLVYNTWIMHENPTRRTGNVSRSAAVERLI